ncbi:beta-defensin 128 [Castor canadensis]|uniref:Beta-defensin n=1 Tax=Castor canadensis TaxID=51338 RepID=A0A8B7V860_CASCN|nr:beta-defensin 128 [Castor canadensis]XP_020043889.1 beta-defensin 128-like [Castor canadensis]
MKLFLVLIILLFVVFTDGARPKRCFNNVAGYCRKRCKVGEIAEVGCLHAQLCCVDEEENRKQIQIQQPAQPPNEKSEEVIDYIILPTVTYFTISI